MMSFRLFTMEEKEAWATCHEDGVQNRAAIAATSPPCEAITAATIGPTSGTTTMCTDCPRELLANEGEGMGAICEA